MNVTTNAERHLRNLGHPERREYLNRLATGLDAMRTEFRNKTMAPADVRKMNVLEAEFLEAQTFLAKEGTISLNNERMTPMWVNNGGGIPDESRYRNNGVTPSSEWRDRDGKTVHVLRREQRVCDLPGYECRDGIDGLSVGRLLKALITNNPRYAQAEMRALGEGINTSGGMLVPTPIAASIVDLARNQSVLNQAGMGTVNMESETLCIVQTKSDPAMANIGENESFPESTVTFGAVNLTARKRGCLVTMSRELAEDSGNAEQILQAQLAAALAVDIDSLALTGGAGDGMLGIESYPGVNTITSHGSAATHFYDKLIDCAIDVEEANGECRTMIAAPATWGYFRKLKSGDAATSALTYLAMPDPINGMQRLSSNQASAGYLYAGDFAQCLLGVRSAIEIAVDSTGTRFEKDQIGVRVRWRGDFAVVRPTHLVVVSGITA